MAVYKPLFVYLEPASIPQVVAHIQKYLAENPIISDEETIAELIREYIAAHPEIIAVASVNGKAGAVVLTGSDIMINPSSAVSVETQLLNLASMINSVGADITQIQANISQIYTTISTLQTDVETNTSNISALQTSVEGHGTRLTTAENDIDTLESAQSAQNTRLNNVEGNISSLQTRMTQAEADIDSNKSNIETLNTNLNTSLAKINSNIMYTKSCHPVAGSNTTIPAETSIDVDIDMSEFPAGFNRKAVIMSYGGNAKVVFTHYLGTKETLKVTLYNPSSDAITYNINTCTFIVFFTL